MSQKSLSKEQLTYYFDILHRDALDRGPVYRRSAEIQTIRQELMHLPEQAFDHTVQNIKNFLIAQKSQLSSQQGQDGNFRKEALNQLFKTPSLGTTANEKVSAVGQTQKI